MGKIGLLVNYDGHWDGAQFMGSSPFGVCVSTEEKLDRLLEKIYQRVGVDRDRYELRLSTMVNSMTGKKILPILCDRDVEFVLVNAAPEIFVEVDERLVTALETVPMHPTSFSQHAEDKAGGGNEKEAVGQPSECGTSRNADKKRKRKSEESYEDCNGSELSNASEEEEEEVDLDYPDPEFSDFGKDRAENCFAANQVWAIYDRRDVMPRIYGLIKKVFSPRLKIQFTWLLPDPDDESEKDWFGVDLPVACGKFMSGIYQETENIQIFSHQITEISSMKRDGRSSYLIYPKSGETWALFRDWDIKWSSDPEKHKPPYKYEIVAVLTDFIENVGIVVAYLGKVEGFVSVFHYKPKNGVLSFNIAPGEMYRFSNRIPSFRLTGKESVGVPEGSFELDPVSLPDNDQI